MILALSVILWGLQNDEYLIPSFFLHLLTLFYKKNFPLPIIVRNQLYCLLIGSLNTHWFFSSCQAVRLVGSYSLTRDWTQALGSGEQRVLTTGLPGNSLFFSLNTTFHRKELVSTCVLYYFWANDMSLFKIRIFKWFW